MAALLAARRSTICTKMVVEWGPSVSENINVQQPWQHLQPETLRPTAPYNRRF
jgi:hypothetical protein